MGISGFDPMEPKGGLLNLRFTMGLSGNPEFGPRIWGWELRGVYQGGGYSPTSGSDDSDDIDRM